MKGSRRFPPAVLLMLALLAVGVPAATVDAATPADPSDVVLVFDFSASILTDTATRGQFATALNSIASRVDAITDELSAGETTISFVTFASRATNVPGCTRLELKASARNVVHFADCLRAVASRYRKGVTKTLSKSIGIDTNYVDALTHAAKLVPAHALRPVVVFFTDGEHDAPRGPPARAVLPAVKRLFGKRTPFALLPVGMGLEKSKRAPLEAGLKRLLTISDVRPCPNGEPFEWSDVVFDSPRAAGQAVAAALERATCASVAGEPVPPGKVRSIQLAAKNGSIAVTWLPPHDEGTSPIEDYAVQCRPSSGGPWVGSTEGVSTATSAVVDHLTNGTSYGCEVAAVSGIGSGEWAESPATAMPIAPPAPRTVPAAPAKPTAEAGDKSARLTLPTAGVANVSGYRYECSTDGGATWPVRQDVPSVDPATQIASLTNGASYVCRAFAENPVGLSGSSSVSDAFRPCGSLFECNPVLPPILGLLGLLLLALLLAALLRWWTGRSKRWITADVDGLPPVLLGRGPLVGLALVRNPGRGTLSDVMPDPTPTADMRIRFFGGDRFEVKTDAASVNARTGQSVVVSDTDGTPHDVTLRAFSRPPETNAGEIDQPTWGAAAASDGWGQPIAATGPQPTAASDQGWD